MKFGYLNGYIVTAEDDESVSLNAKIVCKAEEIYGPLLTTLLTQANLADALAEKENEP